MKRRHFLGMLLGASVAAPVVAKLAAPRDPFASNTAWYLKPEDDVGIPRFHRYSDHDLCEASLEKAFARIAEERHRALLASMHQTREATRDEYFRTHGWMFTSYMGVG